MVIGGWQIVCEMLIVFWCWMVDVVCFSLFKCGLLEVLMGKWMLDNLFVFIVMDLMVWLILFYLLGGVVGNLLCDILIDLIDFDVLVIGLVKLFIMVINVYIG